LRKENESGLITNLEIIILNWERSLNPLRSKGGE
jgi:hypothetical protein